MASVRAVYDDKCGSTLEGQPVYIHIGDQFQLLSKTNADWWHVQRQDDAQLPFYVPVDCVEEVCNTGLSPRRGLSRSEPSLTRFRTSSNEDPSAHCTDGGSSDGELGECFDNPVYALPNIIAPDVEKRQEDVCGRERFSAEYENMKIALDCPPPLPNKKRDIPVRNLEDSWKEFEDSLGRRYFYHSQTNLSSWKPPRKVMHLPVEPVESDCVTEFESKVTPSNEDSVNNNQQNGRETHTPVAAEVERRPLLSDVPMRQQNVPVGRHVNINFMPRLNRYSSLVDDKKTDDSLALLTLDNEKENTEEDKRKTATLPMLRRLPPSKDFLELRKLIANKVSVPERTSRTRSVMVLNENHISEFDQIVTRAGGMKTSKTLPSILLGKTWTSEKNGSLQGFLNVTRYGKKLKKQWIASFVVLNETSLFVFRPPFMLEQTPDIFVDLPGATIKWSKEKSHRKNVFEISAADGAQMLIQDDDKTKADQWVNNIVQTIAKLPAVLSDDLSPIKVLPSPMEERVKAERPMPMSPRLARILGRQKSMKNGTEEPEVESLSCLPVPAVSGHKKKKSMDEMENADIKIKKIKIIERLKNFFSRRPTLESLKAKGIIRDGPVFGCNFLKLCEHEKNNVPSFVRRCVAAIENKDLKTDGIYRVSGNLSQVQKLRFQIDQDKYTGMETEEDVNVLTGLLKLFFRELKEPMIPFSLYDALMKANKIQDKSTKDRRFKELVFQIPAPNADTLRFLFSHLYSVAKFGDQNRMHLPNLAIVFGPTLMWPEIPSTNLAMDMLCQNQVVEYLLLNFHTVFENSTQS